MKMKFPRTILISIAVAGFAAASVVCAYAAYKGHADDSDVNTLLSTYPKLKGTALDSCATCHRSGNVPDQDKPGATRRVNACDYCHVVFMKNKGDIKDTLNPYGLDYLKAGRSAAALKSIAKKDSDGDKASNAAEIAKLTFPGDSASNPSMKIAPHKLLSAKEMKKLSKVITQVVFLSSTMNKAGDYYNSYNGFKLYDLLKAAGMSNDATSVDFISLDGYEKTYTIEDLKKAWPQGAPVLNLSKKDLGDCGWVNYNAADLDPGKPLPPVNIMLAFEENGKKLDMATMDPKSGRINNTGPFRLIVPQFKIAPPDLPEFADKSCPDKVPPENRFHADYDHNAGNSSFAIVAIRINPLPKGTRDFEWGKMRDKYIKNEQIVFFGALKVKGKK